MNSSKTIDAHRLTLIVSMCTDMSKVFYVSDRHGNDVSDGHAGTGIATGNDKAEARPYATLTKAFEGAGNPLFVLLYPDALQNYKDSCGTIMIGKTSSILGMPQITELDETVSGATVFDCTSSQNAARAIAVGAGTTLEVVGVQFVGAGISIIGASAEVTLRGVIFSGAKNPSSENGAALLVTGLSALLRMIDSVVRTSVASAFGGALAIENGGLVSLCGDTVLDKNEAKTAGGAVYMSASTLTVISGCPAELNSLGNTSIISGNAAPKGGA